jgi:hypothetical protein
LRSSIRKIHSCGSDWLGMILFRLVTGRWRMVSMGFNGQRGLLDTQQAGHGTLLDVGSPSN